MALSRDLRKRIIEAYAKKEGSIKDLATRFSVATSTVWELLKRYRNTKQLEAISPPGRTPKVGAKELTIIEQLIQERNDATLSDLCDDFELKTKIRIGTSTMHRACNRLKFRYKKNDIPSGTTTR
jgi:transposase